MPEGSRIASKLSGLRPAGCSGRAKWFDAVGEGKRALHYSQFRDDADLVESFGKIRTYLARAMD